ncbi:MAG TPA: OsmC family protein [Nocardioidaceae bacterium]
MVGQPVSEYVVHARAVAGGAAAVEAGNTSVDLDLAWGAEPTGQPGPADLLASAFAACLLKNLARAHDLIGFEYDGAEVEVRVRRQDSPPKFVEIGYTLWVRSDETERRLDLAHRNLKKYGTVYNTLAAVCDVHGTIEAVPPGA